MSYVACRWMGGGDFVGGRAKPTNDSVSLNSILRPCHGKTRFRSRDRSAPTTCAHRLERECRRSGGRKGMRKCSRGRFVPEGTTCFELADRLGGAQSLGEEEALTELAPEGPQHVELKRRFDT